jgi:hypothetical protein
MTPSSELLGWPAHSWERIEERYRLAVDEGYGWLAPMAELVSRLRRSSAVSSIHALTSHDNLVCARSDVVPLDGPVLVIAPLSMGEYLVFFRRPNERIDRGLGHLAEDLGSEVSKALINAGWLPAEHEVHRVLVGGS